MIERDVGLILLGAAIALAGSIVTTILGQILGYWLSLKEDRIRRERDREAALKAESWKSEQDTFIW